MAAKTPAENVTVRLEAEILSRAERVTEALEARTHLQVSRTSTLRSCILRGLELYEAELGIATKKKGR